MYGTLSLWVEGYIKLRMWSTEVIIRVAWAWLRLPVGLHDLLHALLHALPIVG